MERWTRWTMSVALVLGVVLGITWQLSRDTPVSVTRGRLLMGTLFEITAVGFDGSLLDTWIDSAFAEVARIERLTSDYDSTSLVGMLNRSSGSTHVVGDELAELLTRSIYLADISHGAFDVTIGAATQLWRRAESENRRPSSDELATAVNRIGRGMVIVDDREGSVRLRVGTTIDLGGIAKGYAVDAALAQLVSLNISGAMVNGGGDIATFGRSVTGDEWRIGIRHPRGDATRYFGVVSVGDGAIATTGDYERGYVVGDTVYSHIIDPQSAEPVHGEVVSTTVTAPSTELADALATAVFILGSDAGLEVLHSLPGVEGLLVIQRNNELVAVCTYGFIHSADGARNHARIDTSQIRLISDGDRR